MTETLPADWCRTDPSQAHALTAAREQLHHAVQFAAVFGLRYLPAAADDSHSSLGWRAGEASLSSHAVHGPGGALRVQIVIPSFVLRVLRDEREVLAVALHERAVEEVAAIVRRTLAHEGLRAERYTLERHYALPPHPLAQPHARFVRPAVGELVQLAAWFGNAALVLQELAARTPDTAPIRCWPHHFDLATLFPAGPGATIGVGLSPGDDGIPEPYYYVNRYPRPAGTPALPPVAGGGTWQTHGWFGAALPGSRVEGTAGDQYAQVRAFLHSAIGTLQGLATR